LWRRIENTSIALDVPILHFLFLIFFAVKYYLGVKYSLHPETRFEAQSYLLDLIVSGGLSGYFTGKVLRIGQKLAKKKS